MTFFVRVRDGLVIERGHTDSDAFAVMRAASPEYVAVTREQFDALAVGDAFPSL